MNKELTIIFNTQVDEESMGGGDKIVLNISKELVKKDIKVDYVGCPEGKSMVEKNTKDIEFSLLNNVGIKNFGLIFGYVLRVLLSFRILLIAKKNSNQKIVWSASDFLPDTVPGFLYKLFDPKSKWLISVFLRARNPFSGEVHLSLNTLLYFLSQKLTIMLFKIIGDTAFVLSDPDIEYLVKSGIARKRIKKLSGGVDLEEFEVVPEQEKIYEGVFVGRFHHQKGLDDLIEIWKGVAASIPKARLAIVGWGPEDEVKSLENMIKNYGLENNIVLKGFLDGEEKIKVIKQSKLLLFPSKFESWGVVVAEGIAAEVPVVAYALPEIVGNFEKGVVWIEPANSKEFKEQVLELLSDDKERSLLSKEAALYRNNFSWRYCSELAASAM